MNQVMKIKMMSDLNSNSSKMLPKIADCLDLKLKMKMIKNHESCKSINLESWKRVRSTRRMMKKKNRRGRVAK